jgi:transaldolase
MNPLLRLHEYGQSFWLDNLTREMIQNGELERRITQEGLRGITSNPAIFNKAISGGEEYDEDIGRFAAEGLSVEAIYERLTVADVGAACDQLRPVFETSGGVDGYVSLEVSPHLAHETDATFDEACRLYGKVDRPNVLIKIPGTPAGVPAIRRALVAGVNVNVTLLFAIEAYEAVAEAYLSALEERLANGDQVDDMASVASFFLSRIDTLTDQQLDELRDRPGSEDGAIDALLGQAAVANAKLAYRSFLHILESDRWRRLADAGARPQRMLWASTSTKDPAYRDVRYVEPLIGPHTINTMPESTISAFEDHGQVADTVASGIDEAVRTMADLEQAGIDFKAVTGQLLEEGVAKFILPYDALLENLAQRRDALFAGIAIEAGH